MNNQQQKLTREMVEELFSKVPLARQAIAAMASGKRGPKMSIPAMPGDEDVLIDSCLAHIPALISAWDEARKPDASLLEYVALLERLVDRLSDALKADKATSIDYEAMKQKEESR